MASEYPQPRTWSEMSTDFQLMMVLHGCMIVMWMFGGALTLQQQLMIATALLAIAIAISVWRRRAAHWRWRGASWKNWLSALLQLVLISLFLGASVPLAAPIGPQMLPWFLAGANLGLFAILGALNLVRSSEREFLAECGDAQPDLPEASAPREASWRVAARTAYSIAFIAVWLAGLAFFYLFGVGMRDGAPAPTTVETEALTNHGQTVFITAQAKMLIDIFQTAMLFGIPAIMAAGAFMHFVLKIRVFGEAHRD